MNDRRSLVEGLKSTPAPVETLREKAFVYGDANADTASRVTAAAPAAKTIPPRAPISTRMRGDYAAALKKASLERQLSGIEPNTLQDILEEAVEPWLKANGYL